MGLQTDPRMLQMEQTTLLDPKESKVDYICSLLGGLRKVQWTTDQAAGSELINVPLNSILSNPQVISTFGKISDGTIDVAPLQEIPQNIAMLNMFALWRCNFEFHLMVAKTGFQAGRLQATIAYGAPNVTSSQRNVYENKVLNFTGDHMEDSFEVTFNAATEFLRTYDGPLARDIIQDYSLGHLMICVQGVLNLVNATVSNSVEVTLLVRLLEVRVYESRPTPSVLLRTVADRYIAPCNIVARRKTARAPVQNDNDEDFPNGQLVFNQESGSTDPFDIQEPTDPTAADQPGATAITSSETNLQVDRPCTLTKGRKFEHLISDIHELARRFVNYLIPTQSYYDTQDTTPGLAGQRYGKVSVYLNAPASLFKYWYAAWAGHLDYRITNQEAPFTVSLDNYNTNNFSDYGIWLDGSMMRNSSVFADAGGDYLIQETDYIMSTEDKSHTPLPSMYPREQSYNSGGTNMLNFSVPFNPMLNFCSTEMFGDHFQYPPLSGLFNVTEENVYLTSQKGDNIGELNNVLQACSDDFRFIGLRPPAHTYFCGYVSMGEPTDTKYTPRTAINHMMCNPAVNQIYIRSVQ